MIAGSALCSRDYAGRSLESGVALLVQQIVVSNLLDKLWLPTKKQQSCFKLQIQQAVIVTILSNVRRRASFFILWLGRILFQVVTALFTKKQVVLACQTHLPRILRTSAIVPAVLVSKDFANATLDTVLHHQAGNLHTACLPVERKQKESK